jgi:hypothetical protein
MSQRNSKKGTRLRLGSSGDYKKEMRVPGRIYLDDDAIKTLEKGAVDQVANVACLQEYRISLLTPRYSFRLRV